MLPLDPADAVSYRRSCGTSAVAGRRLEQTIRVLLRLIHSQFHRLAKPFEYMLANHIPVVHSPVYANNQRKSCQ